ncbi:hypothetical protein ACFVSW_23530 [Neobacillus sp. NPDC058068]|uniref:hypothetical protein n=1 Tax=Neobacillus sp. NPDC058068 TaxID=3346325 RepID=UPI0036D89A94
MSYLKINDGITFLGYKFISLTGNMESSWIDLQNVIEKFVNGRIYDENVRKKADVIDARVAVGVRGASLGV